MESNERKTIQQLLFRYIFLCVAYFKRIAIKLIAGSAKSQRRYSNQTDRSASVILYDEICKELTGKREHFHYPIQIFQYFGFRFILLYQAINKEKKSINYLISNNFIVIVIKHGFHWKHLPLLCFIRISNGFCLLHYYRRLYWPKEEKHSENAENKTDKNARIIFHLSKDCWIFVVAYTIESGYEAQVETQKKKMPTQSIQFEYCFMKKGKMKCRLSTFVVDCRLSTTQRLIFLPLKLDASFKWFIFQTILIYQFLMFLSLSSEFVFFALLFRFLAHSDGSNDYNCTFSMENNIQNMRTNEKKKKPNCNWLKSGTTNPMQTVTKLIEQK